MNNPIETKRWDYATQGLVPTNPKPDLSTLREVFRTEIVGGFQFTGLFGETSFVTLRKKATRPYTHAAIHMMNVVSKFVSTDARAYVTFHSSPTGANKSQYSDRVLKVIAITEERITCPDISPEEMAEERSNQIEQS